MNPLNPLMPNRSLASKWTAVHPVTIERHFHVKKLMLPEPLEGTIEYVEIEADFSKAVRRIDGQKLQDMSMWRQGWV